MDRAKYLFLKVFHAGDFDIVVRGEWSVKASRSFSLYARAKVSKRPVCSATYTILKIVSVTCDYCAGSGLRMLITPGNPSCAHFNCYYMHFITQSLIENDE